MLAERSRSRLFAEIGDEWPNPGGAADACHVSIGGGLDVDVDGDGETGGAFDKSWPMEAP